MKTPLPAFLTIAVACWLSACSSVTVLQPITNTTAEVLRTDLEGAWAVEKGSFQLAFNDAGKGEIAFADRAKDQFRLVRGEVAAIEQNDRYYLTVRFEEDDVMPGEFVLAEYHVTENGELVVWMAVPEVFEQAIADGKLQGKVTKSKNSVNVRLSSTPEEILAFLDANPSSVETRDPKIFRRLE